MWQQQHPERRGKKETKKSEGKRNKKEEGREQKETRGLLTQRGTELTP